MDLWTKSMIATIACCFIYCLADATQNVPGSETITTTELMQVIAETYEHAGDVNDKPDTIEMEPMIVGIDEHAGDVNDKPDTIEMEPIIVETDEHAGDVNDKPDTIVSITNAEQIIAETDKPAGNVNAKQETMASKYPRVVTFITHLFSSNDPNLTQMKNSCASIIDPNTFGTKTIPEIAILGKSSLWKDEKERTALKTNLKDVIKVNKETLSEFTSFFDNPAIFENKSTVTQSSKVSDLAVNDNAKPETIVSKFPHVARFMSKLISKKDGELSEESRISTDIKLFGKETLQQLAAEFKSGNFFTNDEVFVNFKKSFENNDILDIETLSEFEKMMQDKTMVGDANASKYIEFFGEKKAELIKLQINGSGKNFYGLVSIIIPIVLASFLSL